MTRMRWCSLWMVLLAAALVPARAADEIDPATWVPADALFYVGITDITQTWADFKTTAAYQMMSDEQVKAAMPEMNVIGVAFEKLQKRIAEALGTSAEQLKNPFKGPCAVYARVPRGAKPDQVEVGVIASVGDAETMKKYYESAVAKFKDMARHESVEAGSNKIDVFTKQEGEEKKDEFSEFEEDGGLSEADSPAAMVEKGLDELFAAKNMPPKVAMCLTADRLVIAGSPDEVQSILRNEVAGGNLADTDDHKALLRQLKPAGPVRMLFNLPRIVELAKMEGEGDADLREALKIIGAESLRSIVGQMRFGASSYDSKFDVLVLMSGERSGLAKILSMENRPTAPPDYVGADSVMYFGLNLDPPKLVEEIERMIRQSDPAAADQFRQGLTQMPPPTGEGDPINFQQEVISHLKGPVGMNIVAPQPYALETIRMCIALGHNDQAAVSRFLAKFGGMLMQRDLRGTPVFDVMLPFPGVAGMSIADGTDRVVIANNQAVERFISGSAPEPLAQSAAFRRAARFVPEQSWLLVYSDGRRLMDAMLTVGKNQEQLQGPNNDLGVMLLTQMFGKLAEAFADRDASESQKLLKYATSSVATVSTTPEGVLLTYVTMKPE